MIGNTVHEIIHQEKLSLRSKRRHVNKCFLKWCLGGQGQEYSQCPSLGSWSSKQWLQIRNYVCMQPQGRLQNIMLLEKKKQERGEK